MEVFKFGVSLPPPYTRSSLIDKLQMYVFFPILIMVHYGDPDWYSRHVLPLKDAFVRADLPQTVRRSSSPPVQLPDPGCLQKPPQNSSELREELEAMKAQRTALRQQRLREEVREASGASAAQGQDRLV